MDRLSEERKKINETDEKIARLLEERFGASARVAAYKKEAGMPVFDPVRERELLDRNESLASPEIAPYNRALFSRILDLSKDYQKRLLGKAPALSVFLGGVSTPVYLENGLFEKTEGFLPETGKLLVLTDSGVPPELAERICRGKENRFLYTVPMGENSKSLSTAEAILSFLQEKEFDRADAVLAVGGGMVCDLGGFVASVYLRGIGFISLPTTLLAQADAAVGGKTGVNFGGVKNAVGSFFPPRTVLIDPLLLKTLPPRIFSEGAAEIIKMALLFDEALFARLENGELFSDPLPFILAALKWKKSVVERDEKEAGLRRVLNFGHTLGHAIEEAEGGALLHGECVALGMIPMAGKEVQRRLLPVLKTYGLPDRYNGDREKVRRFLRADKKRRGDAVTAVYCEKIGSFSLRETAFEELEKRLGEL